MNYLDDIENVRRIYVRFCEFLETMPNDEKHEFIQRMYENPEIKRDMEIYDMPLSYRDIQRFYENEWMFGNFLYDYLRENPELQIYRDEIISMEFNPEQFEEGFEIFTHCLYCLK